MNPDLRLSILKPGERKSATTFWLCALIFCAFFFSIVAYQLYKVAIDDGSIPPPLMVFGILVLLFSVAFFIASVIGLKYSFLEWKLVFSKEENEVWLERKNKRKNPIKLAEQFSIMTRVRHSGEDSFSWELLLSQATGEHHIMNYQLSNYSYDKIDRSRRDYCQPIEDYFKCKVIHLDYEN